MNLPDSEQSYDKRKSMVSAIADLKIDFTYSILNSSKYKGELKDTVMDENILNGLKSLFADNRLNKSEGRSEDHVALRDFEGRYAFSIATEVEDVNVKQCVFAQQFESQVVQGEFDAVIILGVGGSSLGLKLVCQALEASIEKKVEYVIVDNVDSVFLNEVCKRFDLSKCLFIVSSKTFSTLETMTMAKLFKKELCSKMGEGYPWQNNFVAVTANVEKAQEFGIKDNQIFKFWDSISGRFSIWSAIGLPLDLIFGEDTHKELRKGAEKLDAAFYKDISHNNAVLQFAFAQLVNLELFDSKAEAFVAYDSSLEYLTSYLQQLFMESLGKSYTANNQRVDHYTCPLIFGGVGTNDQHSYFQLLHQGKQIVPVTFVEVLRKKEDENNLQKVLNGNMEAQREALFYGRKTTGLSLNKIFLGQKPSTKITLVEMSPCGLGQLMAFFEHVVCSLGVFQGINTFDQWGVELGKEIYNKKN